MKNNIILSLLTFCSINALAMEQEHVNVNTTKHQILIKVNDQTTIADVKSSLTDKEGIPQDIQHIFALEPRWVLGSLVSASNLPLSLLTRSEELANDAYLKNVIEAYNTRELALILTLRPNSTSK